MSLYYNFYVFKPHQCLYFFCTLSKDQQNIKLGKILRNEKQITSHARREIQKQKSYKIIRALPFPLLYTSTDSRGKKFSICVCKVAYQNIATAILVKKQVSNIALLVTFYFWYYLVMNEIELMNCFCSMVDRRKTFTLISSRDYCQRSSPSRISDTLGAGFEPAQNLSSDFVE